MVSYVFGSFHQGSWNTLDAQRQGCWNMNVYARVAMEQARMTTQWRSKAGKNRIITFIEEEIRKQWENPLWMVF